SQTRPSRPTLLIADLESTLVRPGLQEAQHKLAALFTIASNTGWAFAGERRMIRSTLLVAACS
ncbi:MAG: hypothetical protein WA760_00745, partial [Pseudolabrys sp.]